jgi:A/G-specific adenine glycosylase
MCAVKPHPSKSRSLSALQKAVAERLLPWFAQNRRDLPWRRNRTPYRVWVAEIMLQQTRVDTVIDYYRRWMKAFPSWKALAAAPQSDVLKAWEGLGYYSRARNLHAAARIVCDDLKIRNPGDWKILAENLPALGKPALSHLRKCEDFPNPEKAGPGNSKTLEKFLRNFPGIGSYTAAAIASLAFNEDAAVVDGNVIRVLSRLFACGDDPKSAAGKKQMQARADELLVKGRAGEFNEAMMELGALVCVPVAPKCADCPLKEVCAAFAEGMPDKYPVLKKKAKVPHIVVGAAVTVSSRGDVLIAQRLAGDMLGGLWEFPGGKQEPGESIQECVARELHEELGIKTAVGEHLMTVRHAYSHFTMTMHVYFARILSGRPRPIHCADFAWVKIPDLGKFAYSKADLQVVEALQKRTGPRKSGKKG